MSRENFAQVTVEVIRGEDTSKVLQDVKNAVDKISSFPANSERPVIFEQKFRSQVLSILLYGEPDLFNLRHMAEVMRDQLLDIEGISQVTLTGVPDIEFSIEVNEETLRRFRMTFQEIASAVAASNVNISGGKVETQSEEMLIRSWGRRYRAQELHDIPVRGNTDGTVIRLGDVATLTERWQDIPDRTYYNGRNAVMLVIEKTRQEDILDIARRAKALIAEFNETHTGVQALVMDDRTVPLLQRLDLLITNGIQGLVLVVLMLWLFLNIRMAFWVAAGIPFAFMGMFIVLYLAGITVNAISLFGMIIVVGILVDDAIVVGENIYAHFERGKPPLQAAIEGAYEMLGPVCASVGTTIIVFVPFFFLDGVLGKFIWHLAAAVIASLCFSLVEAFLILPAHLAHSKGLQPQQQENRLRRRVERGIDFFTVRIYGPILRFTMDYKWLTVVTPAAIVMITIGLLRGGFIHATFFPEIDGDTLPISLSLTAGAQEQETNRHLARIEAVCMQVNAELARERADGRDIILGIKREIGLNDFNDMGSHAGRSTLQLLDGETRDMFTSELAARLREAVGPVPEAQKLSFGSVSMFGRPVSVSLLGNNLDMLKRARDLLIAELKNFSSLKDVIDSEQDGRREIDVTLKSRAHALGLTARDVIGQVRQGFFGYEAQRIQRGPDEIRVWVRYPEQDRSSAGFLDQMRIRTPQGEYPFSELAGYEVRRGISQINHLNRRREITVEASLADEKQDLPPLLAEIREQVIPRVLSQVQGVHVSYEGQAREQNKTTASIARVFPLALACMFIMIVLVHRSVMQAALVFSLIPLGLSGAIWGHGIQGLQLNMLSLYGIIALTGIVVNDSIVFIDQINRNLRSGLTLEDSVYQSGLSRLRPILLTTFTTVIGLGPIMLEGSRQAQFLIPMAVSVAYGLLFGTFIMLIVLPAGFLVLNTVRRQTAWLLGARTITPENVEPAVKELESDRRFAGQTS
ncbi:MAG: efflux RND transporter permease subunit [Deltaproteobacteria bacterium]|nr:efflux RND transporter permease subunit [Deltaproteobacteria bacterium]